MDYKFTNEGLYVTVKPTNALILAENPYSYDNKLTWSKNTECVYSQTGTYYISVKNFEGDIKTKIITIDIAFQTVTIEDEEAALANASGEKEKSGFKFPFKIVGIVILCLAALAGIGFLVITLLAGSKGSVINNTTDDVLGNVKIKKKGDYFEVIISDKILLKNSDTLAILPDTKFASKYIGYSLTVKSSMGTISVEISDRIELEF